MSINGSFSNAILGSSFGGQLSGGIPAPQQSKLFPSVQPLSGLNNLRVIDPFGTPDVSTLSAKEISIVFKAQLGAYDQLQQLDPLGQAFIEQQARQAKVSDGADVLLQPALQEVRNSELYQQVKAMTGVGSGTTSRDLFQASVDQSIDPAVRAALFLRAQSKRSLMKTSKDNVRRAIEMGAEDPGTAEARKKAEEADEKARRAVLGLDEKE